MNVNRKTENVVNRFLVWRRFPFTIEPWKYYSVGKQLRGQTLSRAGNIVQRQILTRNARNHNLTGNSHKTYCSQKQGELFLDSIH